jgi:hypothetical protein
MRHSIVSHYACVHCGYSLTTTHNPTITMPQKRHRRDTLQRLHRYVSLLHHQYMQCEVLDEYDSDEDDRYYYYWIVLHKVLKKRYLYRSPKYRDLPPKFDLQKALSDDNGAYNDEEFSCYFRITRELFFYYWMKSKTQRHFNRLQRQDNNNLWHTNY